MKKCRRLGKLIAIVAPAILFAATAGVGSAASKSKSFKASFSGTSVTVPLDIDLDSCSATPPYVCTDLSGYATYAGKITGGGIFSGPFTGESVGEVTPVEGTGCSLNPTGWQSCTLGSVTDACQFTFVGGSFVNQKTTGDVAYGSVVPGGSMCIDYNSAGGFATPYAYSQTVTWTVTGGTGKLAGSTGSATNTLSGQILSNDLQGHNFGWFTATSSGTTP